MGLTQVSTDGVKNDAITKVKIPANQIEASELADNSVNTTQLVDDAVTIAKLADDAVGTTQIADQAVSLSKLPHGTSSNDGKFLRANNGADPSFETVTSTTINNNADNRVITGSGTANTLNAESNLTYDGSTLIIGANAPKLKFNELNDNPDYFINANAGELNIHDDTNSSTKLTITATQTVFPNNNIGIGTSSISAKLHVSGGDGLLVERSSGTSIAGFKHSGASAMNIYFQNTGSSNHASIGSSNQDLTLGTNNNERVRVASGGTIGIGHSSPRGQVMINSDKNALINANCNDPHHFHINLKNDNDTNGEAIGVAFSASSTIDRVGAAIIHKRLGAGSVGDLRFYICRTEGTTLLAQTITQNREVRLGTQEDFPVSTDPVNSIGDPSLGSITSNLARLVIQERSGDWISFKTGSAHYGTISRSGSGVSYGSNSDYRLKDNVADLTGGITLLKQLRPVTFNWNDLSGASTVETHQGFIAHEVQAIVPDAVLGEKDGMDIWGDCKDSEGNVTQTHVSESKKKEGETWTKTGEGILDQQLDTSKLVPLLVAAVQELITKVESLEAA